MLHRKVGDVALGAGLSGGVEATLAPMRAMSVDAVIDREGAAAQDDYADRPHKLAPAPFASD